MPSYDQAGPKAGFPIVLLLANPANRKMWMPHMERLSETSHVMAMDLPGSGAVADSPFSFERAAHDLSEMITRETRAPVLLVGYSFRGYVVLDYAVRHPEQVVGLVLGGCSHALHGWKLRIIKATGTIVFKQLGERQIKRQFARLARKMKIEALMEAIFEAGFSAKGLPPLPSQEVILAQLRIFPGPVLILNGECDTFQRKGEAAFLAAASQPSLSLLKGADHLSVLACSQEVTEGIRSFASMIRTSRHA